MMTKGEHIKRHLKLHKYFDELLADFIRHTNGVPSKSTLLELLKWSHSQTINPTEKS